MTLKKGLTGANTGTISFYFISPNDFRNELFMHSKGKLQINI